MQTESRPPLAIPAAPAWIAAFETAPGWLRWSGAALLGYTLFLLTPTGARMDGTAGSSLASAIRLCIEGTALLWACRRADLPLRFVRSFQIAGWTSFATAFNYMLLVPQQLGGPTIVSPTVDSVLTVLGYGGTLLSLLVYPRAPARPGEHSALAIDTLVTTAGLGLLAWTFVTATSAGRALDPVAQSFIQAFGVAQVAMIAGLNVMIVRGLAVPSPRAFWWYVSGLALYLPVIFLTQLNAVGLVPNWPIDIAYYGGVLPTLVACHAVRTDPMTHAGHTGPTWLRDLNPVPLVMPLFVGIALLATLVVGPADKALPLAATLVAISLLLAVRLLLSAHHTAVLGRAEAAREQRRQADRLKAIGRLAGGIAHEFNNLMARVIGNTELGEASLPAGAEAREHFVRARTAALRAADLTSQLLAFSGQQVTRLEIVDAEATVHACYNRAVRGLPTGIAPDLQRGHGPYAVFADAGQLSAALEQVLDNAVEAMTRGGHLTVRVGREHVRDGLRLAQLAVPPGDYVVIAVSDTGVGMTAEAVAVACDPFYSTKPAHLGAGLGLASVHGFIAAHSGGLAIESAPGLGTTVRFYLPAA
jgi:signal transduction histidine kinase